MKTLVLMLLVMGSLCYAQEYGLQDEKAIEEACDSVMEEFLQMNYGGAFQIMNEFSAVKNEDFEKLKLQSIEQSSFVIQNYGQSLEFIKIKEKELEGVLKEITYVIRHEKYGLQFRFLFYRGKGDLWRMTNFLWNDELKKLIAE